MPVPGGRFEAEMPLRRKVPGDGLVKDHGQENRPDDHMRAVEAGGHEEGRTVDVARECEAGMPVFIGLTGGKDQPKAYRKNEAEDESSPIAMHERMMSPGHG